ncbi:polyprenyl synthetase family protein [Streptococcus massiliensis]|uniref:Farnesyl diphosphate synthase n=1 Tax=Streptococcus massiliensis TaxID=313439 RepID=A0A380KVI0_9STRE|nr:farnesyl diphosphate synthase [Streptococcus massiliensis]SUN75685.1 farnesyl diphosphate synthase [Streptococcus massiliensis]
MNTEEKIARIGQTIADFYADKELAPELVTAILYSVEAGGKRIRPLLFLEILESLGLELTEAHLQVAAAVEMVHTGSLIHDDLPAMDNDDYRRGRLTSHKKFGEDLAILAGDSLFLDPYALLAQADLDDTVKIQLIRELSLAAGTAGMVGGQVLDMQGEKQQVSLEKLKLIHANKTGKLLTFPFVAAGLVAKLTRGQIKELRQIGQSLGLAFQVRDDILDITASFEDLGKTPQKDLVAEKSTYPALLGLDGAKAFFADTLNGVLRQLQEFAEETKMQSEKVKKRIESLRINE